MVIAMFLAHLMGDFVLQWDGLAQWKSRELTGVVVHTLVVFAVTALLALPIDPAFWPGVVFISASHFLIDAAQFYFRPAISPLARFAVDQSLHLTTILLALVWSGYLEWGSLGPGIVASAQETPALTALLGYTFLTMPAWVLLKFVVYGVVKHEPPDFPAGPNKFVGIFERVAIATLVLFGPVLLVPLVALPRVIVTWPRVTRGNDSVYLIEFLSSAGLAIVVGLGLNALAF